MTKIMHMKNEKTVAVLMATYNGAEFISEQLDSIANQTYANWNIYVSDDGSNDTTYQILSHYKRKWAPGKLTIHSGPQKGYVANFLSLTCNEDIKADYYAYSDQDDVWEKEKLERALQWLKKIPESVPALYCSRTLLVNIDNKEIGKSTLFRKPPDFANALVQNIGGGNTMIFNNATRNLLIEGGKHVPAISHDWWLYMVVTGCGGHVHYDTTPTLRYRQHNKNLVGMNMSWIARLNRLSMLWNGQFKIWNDRNIQSLEIIKHKLTTDNIKKFEIYKKSRKEKLLMRLIELKRAGIYRQTAFGNMSLYFAAIFKKI